MVDNEKSLNHNELPHLCFLRRESKPVCVTSSELVLKLALELVQMGLYQLSGGLWIVHMHMVIAGNVFNADIRQKFKPLLHLR